MYAFYCVGFIHEGYNQEHTVVFQVLVRSIFIGGSRQVTLIVAFCFMRLNCGEEPEVKPSLPIVGDFLRALWRNRNFFLP